MDDALPWLKLAFAFGFSTTVRPGSAAPLLETGLDPSEWLAMDAGELEARGVGPAQRRRLFDPRTGEQAARALRATRERGLAFMTRGGRGWPSRLAELPGAPLVLWFRGDATRLDRVDSIAVVGARHPTAYGLHAARDFTEGLVLSGMDVASGLARGIDRQAHETALACGARTIAVLGSALDRTYPAEHASLAERIVGSGGLVLSEYPPGYRANPGTFPRRNRILAALARGVLVVEAGLRSGALITSEWALLQDRPVWAVPGPYSSLASAGCNRLIRDGAFLAESPAGLLEDLGVAMPQTTANPVGTAVEARVLEVLGRGPRVLDALLTELPDKAPLVLKAVARLEVAGRVECRADGMYWRGGPTPGVS